MIAANPKLETLSDADRQSLESWLVQFDQSWDENRLADQVRERLPVGTPVRLPGLIELIKIDLKRQWQRGRQPTVETYLEAYPELGDRDTAPADLLQAEYAVRRQFGASASWSDFAQRFPRQVDALRQLLEQSQETVTDSPGAQSSLATIQPAPSTVSTARPSGDVGVLPEQFGRYRIVRRLGKGGMGSVYLVHDCQLDRQVALKVPNFRPDDDPEILQRFYREARAAAALHHPNLCPVYDVGEVNGIHFLTMAYISGPSLAEYARAHQPVPQEQVAILVRKVALALAQVHQHGVIHRDLKPSNIMLDAQGEPVVMDFGLARRVNTSDTRLHPGRRPPGHARVYVPRASSRRQGIDRPRQ
jgi:predicted Ser/Thr protein kinase